MRRICIALLTAILLIESLPAQSRRAPATAGDRLLAKYFRGETKRLTDRTFADIATLEDWTDRKAEYRRQMLEMLSLDPMPEKTPLKPVITKTLEQSGVTVENLQFQSMPGL